MSSQTPKLAPQHAGHAAGSKPAAAALKEAASKMHRRSRTGCFTCRLRRKKCDEGKPACRSCRHLRVKCDYKRPLWWTNTDQRSQQKEIIKDIIKQTKLTERNTPFVGPPTSINTPPSLCHSLPTEYSDAVRTRAASEDSQFSPGQGFKYARDDYFGTPRMPPPNSTPYHHQFPLFSPYEVDIKTERELYVNDIPTKTESTVSTFSTYQPPPPQGCFHSHQEETWIEEEYFEQRRESFAEEPVDFKFFSFPHRPNTPSHEAVVHVDECDRYLLSHFIENVLRLVLPVLEVNQHGSARSNVILPALESNKCYLHCCLSVSALHLQATQRLEDEQIENDIMRHRYAAISELCEALTRDENHLNLLEATLGMILFQCSVGKADNSLPDVAWHQHFQAVINLVQKLDLAPQFADLYVETGAHASLPFNMTLTAWIDILGATMLGRTPSFADLYREKHLSGAPAGLAELMGCDDRIMFLISEIACLESIKDEGAIDDVTLCAHISHLGEQLNLTEPPAGTVANAFSATGAFRPKQLCKNMTCVFRLAARIHLASLVPGFQARSQTIQNLVAALTDAMDFIPAGPDGFDRSLVWPLLIAGAASTRDSSFRAMFSDRAVLLGEAAAFGSYGRVNELLRDVWQMNDQAPLDGEGQSVHWRDVMRQKNWDFLLI